MARLGDTKAAQRPTELDRAVAACRTSAWALGAFGLAINLLMLASPLYMLQVYDRVMVTGRVETLVMLTVLTAAALLLFGVLDALRSSIAGRVGCWLSDRLGPVYLAHGVRARLLGGGAGAQPLRDLQSVQNFVSSPALTAFFDAPWAPVFLVLIWLLHPWLGVLATGSTALLVALGVLNELYTRSPTARANRAQIAATQQAEEAIRNAEVVWAMGMLPAMLRRWCDTNRDGLAAARRANEWGGLLLGVTKFVRFFVQSATLGLGAYLVLRREVSGGAMIASSILLGRALGPVESMVAAWRNFGLARIAYGRLQAQSRSLPEMPARTRLPAPAGHLELDRVTYAPPGARAPVLVQVSFEARPGEAIAVIGPSAGGKSTLCRLLVGIAEPSAGEIRLDGSELRHWSAEELGRHVGYLPQDVELFSGTIRDNIARMNEAQDEAVVEAAMLAQAHEVIQRLPQGYDTIIGEGGMRLSGGQRQRIGLARAVHGLPRLIVLDEPNANLDQTGEAALAAAVEELKRRGCTLLIVGHRPSTLAQADKILLLQDGRVEMFGPRDEVLQRLRAAAGRAAAAETPAAETRSA